MNKRNLYILLGILVTVLIFFLIETVNPYNFLEDDNAVDFLPMVIEGMEQLFSGNLPSINTHQLMGTKILEAGTYSVFYPITILSYFLAHFVFGNDFIIFEIFVLIHLILGFILTFIFLNTKTKNLLSCFLGALAFVFSGYGIGLTRAWYYVIPIILFLPLIFYLNDKLSKKPGSKKLIVYLGIVRGIFFYSGNVQYFIFTLFFEFLYFLIREYQQDWKCFYIKLKDFILSLIMSFIILFPLLFSQMNVSLNSSRGDIPILKYLFSRGALPTDSLFGSIIFPGLLISMPSLFRYSSVHYSGVLFSLLFFIGGIFLIRKYKKASFKKISPIFWLGLISIVLSWGIFGFFYSIGALLPFIKNFEGPFKFIIFANFFMICFGAIIFSRVLESKKIKKTLISIIIVLFFILLLSSVFFISKKSEANYFEKLPLDKEYFKNIHDFEGYRFISIATGSEFSPKTSSNSIKTSNFPESYFLSKNFATYFSLDHISGYEPFKDKLTAEKIPVFREGVSNKHLNLPILSEYGVKYIIIFKQGLEFHSELNNLEKIYEEEDFLILEIPNPKSYVYSNEGDINYTRLNNGFLFNTAFKKAENVTINLLYKKGYICKVNGESISYFQDSFGRMIVNIPEGENEVSFHYFPEDFIVGCLISLVFCIMLVLFSFSKKKLKKFLLKFPIKRLFRFLSRNKWKLFILIIILIIILVFSLILSKSNIEESFENKFGMGIKMDKISWGFNNVGFEEVYISDSEGVNFYSSEIILKPDYGKSIKETLSSKHPIIFFKEVSFSNISIEFKNKENGGNIPCDLPLNVSYPLFLENTVTFNLSKENLILTQTQLLVPNKLIFTLHNQEFELLSGKDKFEVNITADLIIGRYVSGEIYVEDPTIYYGQKNKQGCLILPIEKNSNLFY